MVRRQPLSRLGAKVNSMLLAIHPHHAEAILTGRKTVEIRRRFPLAAAGGTVFMYVTAPVSAIVGGFKAEAVWTMPSQSAWDCLGGELCINREALERYSQGAATLTPIRVSQPFRLARPLGLERVKAVVQHFHPPQSFGYVRDQSLAEMLVAAMNESSQAVGGASPTAYGIGR